MENETVYTEAMRDKGKRDAEDFQARAATGEMDGTAICAEEEKIPLFTEAVKVMNMNKRPAGQTNGFICISPVGNVVRLIQGYDSDIYTQDPESKDLAAHWRFVFSKDPKKAKEFLGDPDILAVNYYNIDECCIDVGHVWRSKLANNVYRPSEYTQGWEDLGTIESVMGV